jgi:hypothetical protein
MVIHFMLIRLRNYDFSPEEEGNYTNIKSSLSLEVGHRILFGHWRGFPSHQQESF